MDNTKNKKNSKQTALPKLDYDGPELSDEIASD